MSGRPEGPRLFGDRLVPAEVTELLRGAIDVHVHANPHLFPQNHAQDVVALATQAKEAGMRALAIKDVGVPTTGTAYVVTRLGPGIPVYGSYVMNLANGGINPRGVQVALTHGDGAKIVYFPTGDTLNHVRYRKRFYAGINLPLAEEQAIAVLKDGRLIPEVREVIALVKEYDACLATAHLSAVETHAVVREARDQGLRRIIASHAKWAMTGLTLEDAKELAGKGCFIELEASLMMPLMYFVHGEAPADPRDIAATMRAVGPEHCLIVSDLGQLYSPMPVEGLRTYVAMLLKCGLSAKEIELMLHRNPARVLGLE
jgi:Family of unknown function (DUF6282)